VRRRLLNTRKRMESILNGESAELESGDWYDSEQELAQPLLACYWSLWECGGGVIANGRLLDLVRRVGGREGARAAAAAAAALLLPSARRWLRQRQRPQADLEGSVAAGSAGAAH
jgi:hypothetical protein